jgi:glutathione synthase/RimK-type ligase-like ATP-grasp enzyme
MVYVVPGFPLPQPLPAHDVAIVAATELAENQPVLDQLATLVASWPRPVLNAPQRIARLTRDGAWALLHSVSGVVYPANVRIDRAQLGALGVEATNISEMIGFDFPMIVRPVDSHAGHGLALIAESSAIGPYLNDHPAQEFFVAPFVDYRGADGLYRKYRVAIIDGRPHACHMAISRHWMIHYLNAGMMESADKRAEEARFMAEFDRDFAPRHSAALAGLAERIGLDYVTMDCAETRDGRLLVFEVGNGMIVHAMDPPALFPYKAPQMRKVFAAFEAMLRNASATRRPAAA